MSGRFGKLATALLAFTVVQGCGDLARAGQTDAAGNELGYVRIVASDASLTKLEPALATAGWINVREARGRLLLKAPANYAPADFDKLLAVIESSALGDLSVQMLTQDRRLIGGDGNVVTTEPVSQAQLDLISESCHAPTTALKLVQDQKVRFNTRPGMSAQQADCVVAELKDANVSGAGFVSNQDEAS